MSNKLALTQAALTGAKDLKEMFELEPVRNNAISNYVKTTGRSESEGAMYYEREKILFFKALQANKKIEQCDRFTIYSSWIELMVSGLTLNDGLAYLIPYGKQLQMQIGWKGRLEQLIQVPGIENVPPPQVVYENDIFDYELGDKPKIIKHIPAKIDKGKLSFVYLVIQKTTGNETHIMTREEVIDIRDRYSQGYKQYVTDCKAASKNIGETFKKDMGSWQLTIEPPMWVSSEPEAWKKTLIKRVWKYQPKTARMKALDEKIKNNIDNEDGTKGDTAASIDYGINQQTQDVPHTDVDTSTGEVKEKPAAATKQKDGKPDLGNPEESF